MSTGERSCSHYANNCPEVVEGVTDPAQMDCSVNCPSYVWNGETEPDTKMTPLNRGKTDYERANAYVREALLQTYQEKLVTRAHRKGKPPRRKASDPRKKRRKAAKLSRKLNRRK